MNLKISLNRLVTIVDLSNIYTIIITLNTRKHQDE